LNDDNERKKHDGKVINQIIMINGAMKGYKSQAMYYYCLMYQDLMQLQVDHKHSNKKLDDIVNNVLEVGHGFSRSNRDFFIDYYKLALTCNKLMYVKCTTVT